MGRGRLLKTKLKEAKKFLEIRTKTAWKLELKKPLEVSLKEHLGKLIDRLDVPEMVAVMGVTLIVKRLIDTSEEVRDALKLLGLGPRFRVGPVSPFARSPLLTALGVKGFGDGEKFEGMFPDWMDWIIAFTLAYLIVKNFGSIMHSAGNVLGSVKSMVLNLLLGGVGA